ncbi:MAG: efflux RND transporter periplasmic adaptor subunit [Burkholderiaceae bacterium]
MNSVIETIKANKLSLLSLALVSVLALGAAWVIAADEGQAKDAKPAANGAPRAALTVSATLPQAVRWPTTVAANGSIAAWQEAIVGSESSGLRLAEVRVNVGDTFKKGAVWARFASQSVAAEVAAQKAAVVEAEATLAEAQANSDRAKSLQASGAISAQQILQFDTAAKSAAARLASAKARLAIDQLRLSQTNVLAPDDGVITARMATVGQVAQPGQELFKLIRQNRLEWRAEVTSSEAVKIKAGQVATVNAANGAKVTGKVRIVAPTVDASTRNALVYVDLPASANPLKAGMFASGSFELGSNNALTVPQQALVLRDGFSYLFAIQPDNKVVQLKVSPGRRVGDRVEILEGIKPEQRVVAAGAAFLADGDTVKVVAAPAAPTAAAATNAAQKQ